MPIRSDVVMLKVRLADAPRFAALLQQRILDAGAHDLWTSPVTDRDGQPGVELTVIAPASLRDAIEAVIVTNTTARDIVAMPAELGTIETSSEQITTRFGDVTITHRRWQGRIIDIEPDAAACEAYAREHDIPASTVWNEAYRIGEARIGQKR
jgi:pyridinium-3,5-bisthiocarboxylic acid mononucleotide nickel chelatase